MRSFTSTASAYYNIYPEGLGETFRVLIQQKGFSKASTLTGSPGWP